MRGLLNNCHPRCPLATPLFRTHAIGRRFNVAAASTDHDIEFSPDEVSSAEVASFERIAAALVAKIEDIPDGKYHACDELHVSMQGGSQK